MKEMRSLEIKNLCFDEVDYDSLTQEQNDKALPLLMFMVMKRNGILNSRGVANGKNRSYTLMLILRHRLQTSMLLNMPVVCQLWKIETLQL